MPPLAHAHTCIAAGNAQILHYTKAQMVCRVIRRSWSVLGIWSMHVDSESRWVCLCSHTACTLLPLCISASFALALACRRVCWQSNCCIFWWRMLMNRLGTHSSIGLKPTSALQTACRHAMHSIQFMLRRMLPSVLNSYMPAPQHPVLNQWQIYKQGSSFSFVYGPCTSKSVDWLHLMTHRYSYNISCSISHTVVLSRLTVVRQGMSSYRYNWEFQDRQCLSNRTALFRDSKSNKP